MATKKDYYEILGVERDATLEQLKSAYRKAALQHHPDRNQGDAAAEAKFKEAAEAYAVLADPDRRALYDRFGHEGLRSGGMTGFDPGAFADFEDLFGGIFGDLFGFDAGRARGRSGGRGAPRHGADLRFNLEIEFEEAALGTKTQIRIPHSETCPKCEGRRAESPSDIVVCAVCRGTGQQRFSQGFFTIARTCGTCRGGGRTIRKACPECRGAGELQKEKTLEIAIPAGVESGMRLRITGEGDAGPEGGPPGDLYVFITVKEHPFFHRDGLDLCCTVPITFSQAALGAELKIQGLQGPEKIKIPPGTQTGSILRVKGRGVSVQDGYHKGDLAVEVVVRTPTRLSRDGRKLLLKLTEIGDDDLSAADRALLEKLG
ncbi:MAG TPA: molecular chaperone DnaJ [Candidatus Polarisedimenticolia bacterium]|nr:molecular chaperone DnaJ [Candidatus Polarisedimenticolia bacterium]